MKNAKIKKVVLAYSGGLDTSVILKWLQDQYGCEVVTFTADIGQGEELEPARKKAVRLGVPPKHIFIEDLREEFVRDFVFPMFRANAVYEGEYLLGTSIARPLIAKGLVEAARKTGADAISHGATGKGNDQVRFELGAYALMPEVNIIAPWREWDLLSREKLLKYAEDAGIEIELLPARIEHLASARSRQKHQPDDLGEALVGMGCQRSREPFDFVSVQESLTWLLGIANEAGRRIVRPDLPTDREREHLTDCSANTVSAHRRGSRPL